MAFELNEDILNTAAGSIEGDIKQIQAAIYGREVRASIAEALYLLYTNQSAIQETVNTHTTQIESLLSDVEQAKTDIESMQSAISELQQTVQTQGNAITGLQQMVGENTDAIETLTGQLHAIESRLDKMEETVSDLTDDTIIYTEPSGGNVTAIAYGNGDIYINGSGSATTPFSATLTQRVRDVYTASSVWSVSDGVTGLCDGYMLQLGMIAATTSEIPLLRLPVTVTEIGDNALPSWNISFAGSMDQWRAIKSYGTENTITNAIVTSTMRSLISVGCTDGKLSWDSDTSTWEEVSA